MNEGWIIVNNWDTFQHYKNRDPVWIKLYTSLNRRDDWLHLTLAARGLLVCLWVEYAASNGQIHTSGIPQRLLHKVDSRTFDSLVAAGFIRVVASKPLALARAREEEKRREDSAPVDKKRKAAKARTPAERIERMITNGVISDPVHLHAEITAAHLGHELELNLLRMLRPL